LSEVSKQSLPKVESFSKTPPVPIQGEKVRGQKEERVETKLNNP